MTQPVDAVVDVINYLKDDTELQTLMGDSSQFYPLYEDSTRAIPYIIYDWNMSVLRDMYWLRRDNVSIKVYSDTLSDAAAVSSRIIELLGKDGDNDSLAALNAHATANGSNWDFKNTRFRGSDQLPPKEEGGLIRRFVNFDILYTQKSGQV